MSSELLRNGLGIYYGEYGSKPCGTVLNYKPQLTLPIVRNRSEPFRTIYNRSELYVKYQF